MVSLTELLPNKIYYLHTPQFEVAPLCRIASQLTNLIVHAENPDKDLLVNLFFDI